MTSLLEQLANDEISVFYNLGIGSTDFLFSITSKLGLTQSNTLSKDTYDKVNSVTVNPSCNFVEIDTIEYVDKDIIHFGKESFINYDFKFINDKLFVAILATTNSYRQFDKWNDRIAAKSSYTSKTIKTSQRLDEGSIYSVSFGLFVNKLIVEGKDA